VCVCAYVIGSCFFKLGHRFEVANNMFATNPEQAFKYHHTGVEIGLRRKVSVCMLSMGDDRKFNLAFLASDKNV
jgi:hypothetical protein